MRRVEVLIGKQYSNWTVLAELRSIRTTWGKIRVFRCKCVCGNVRRVRIGNILRKTYGHCLKCRPFRPIIHGMYYLPERRIWQAMWNRCTNPRNHAFKWYGKLGVCVSPKWEDFPTFLADMGRRPSPEHSLDRWPDPSGNYEPGNCRWATRIQQARNRRVNRLITFNGRTLPVSEWAELLHMKTVTLWVRLFKMSWTVERALTQPVQAKKPYRKRK